MDMSDLLADVRNNFLVVFSLAVVLGLGLLVTLQRRRTGATVRGMRVVLVALLTGPLHFIRSTLGQLADRGARSASEPATGRQVLARRLLTAAQAVVVVVALLKLAVGGASAFTIAVPTLGEFRAHRDAQENIDSLVARLGRQDQVIAALDTQWNRDSSAMLLAYADSLTTAAATASAEMQGIVALINNRSPSPGRRQLLDLVGELQATTSIDFGTRRFARRLNDLMESLRGIDLRRATVLGFTPEDSTLLEGFLGQWQSWRLATNTLQRWPNASSRETVLPTRAAVAVRDSLENARSSLQEQLPFLAESARWKFVEGGIALGAALWAAFLFVWVAGLIIEVLWLLLHMAEDLRRLRSHFNEAESDAPPPRRPSGVVAGQAAYRPSVGTGAVAPPSA
jgi:hypothetical protein